MNFNFAGVGGIDPRGTRKDSRVVTTMRRRRKAARYICYVRAILHSPYRQVAMARQQTSFFNTRAEARSSTEVVQAPRGLPDLRTPVRDAALKDGGPQGTHGRSVWHRRMAAFGRTPSRREYPETIGAVDLLRSLGHGFSTARP